LSSFLTFLGSSLCLQNLNVAHTAITDIGMKSIILLSPHLVSVNLSGCLKITNVTLSLLAQYCHQLTDVIAPNCPSISDHGVCLISQELKASLRVLDLNGCTSISDKTLLYLGHYNPNLTHLRLKDTSVSSLLLSKLILKLSLVELCVQGLRLTDNFLELILQSQAKLSILDIGFCHLLSFNAVRNVAEGCELIIELNIFGNTFPQAELEYLSSIRSSLVLLY